MINVLIVIVTGIAKLACPVFRVQEIHSAILHANPPRMWNRMNQGLTTKQHKIKSIFINSNDLVHVAKVIHPFKKIYM